MGDRFSVLAVTIAIVMLASLTIATGTPTVDAKGSKSLVPCPRKVGAYRLDRFDADPEYSNQSCDYLHPNPKKGGSVRLGVKWYPDIQGERDRCSSRSPRLVEDRGAWLLESPSRRVDGYIAFYRDPKVSLAAAETALRRLMARPDPWATRVSRPSRPRPAQVSPARCLDRGVSCGTTGMEVDPPAVVAMDDGSFRRRQLVCDYRSAYADDDESDFVWLEWYESDPGETALCSARSIEKRGSTRYWRGYHPVAVEVSHGLAERPGGQALADALEAAAATRTSRCPDAPEGPAPYEESTSTYTTDAAAPGTTFTTIVLSGGKDDEPPRIGAHIVMPKGEGHRIFIGDPDGEATREESLGDQAEIVGYGPMARDADGNWTVSVEVRIAPEPESRPQPEPETRPEPEPEPEPQPEPEPAEPEPTRPNPQPVPEPQPQPQPEPQPQAEPEPKPADAAELGQALVDDLKAQLDAAAATGGGTIKIDAALIDRFARLPVVTDKVTAVRLMKDDVVLIRPPDKDGNRPSPVEVYPRAIDGKLDIDLWTTMLIRMPVPERLLKAMAPGLPELIDQAKAAVNGALKDKGLKVTAAPITPEGITIVVEKRA